MKITINGEVFNDFDIGALDSDPHISYERIVTLAGLDPAHNPSVTYDAPRKGDEQRSGGMRPGSTVRIEDGMYFYATVTGNA